MEPRNKGGRPPGSDYPHKVNAYLDEEGRALLEALCSARGLGQSALLRVLIREEAKRQRITVAAAEPTGS